MYAPINHPAMKAVASVRKALGVRTAFNLLGDALSHYPETSLTLILSLILPLTVCAVLSSMCQDR